LAVCAAVLGFAIGMPCGVALARRRCDSNLMEP
jgi:hypothetical protein